MRRPIRLLAALTIGACTGHAPTDISRLSLAPPTLSLSGMTRVTSASGVRALEIAASLRNSTRVRIQVAVGAQCPLFVKLFPDATGAPVGSLGPSMGCAPGGPTIDLAPGDTALLTRVLPGDSLASFVPGTYGVNVAVTTSTGLLGAWAGAVHLPLGTAP